ncbi:hypothetical protein GJAV_G00023320 [Gymnothorax javanicus]|nr:hypothetical protein GJAV_G00023320 [Gymnothorax javanicus]
MSSAKTLVVELECPRAVCISPCLQFAFSLPKGKALLVEQSSDHFPIAVPLQSFFHILSVLLVFVIRHDVTVRRGRG